MHLTRPKSSKGRSRASVRPPDGIQSAALTPKPPVEHSRPDSYLRSQSHTMIRQTHQMRQESQDEVAHMLQFGPSPPALSLNKYMVLPSIEKRRSELSMEKGPNKLSDNCIRHKQHRHTEPNLPTSPITQSNPEMGNVADVNCRVSLMPPESYLKPETTGEPPTAGPRGSLLLAIRVPCGRRFEQHYLFTDTLLTVIASAEARYGTMYGGFIETMDVPRQTFTDLDMTLAQCGILNKSLLCISQEDSSVYYA